MNQKPNDRFNLRELFNTLTEAFVGSSNSMQDIPDTTTPPPLDTLEPRRCCRR